jgi:glycosyltransferase involved in cell wall biosynthesis
MKIAWFIHRYFPCVGGAEGYARAMVLRFVEAGHEVDVHTSDAHDLWYFTNKTRKRIDAPATSTVDGATVRRFPVKHIPMQRYFGRLLSYAPHWPTRCVAASYMPILPGLNKVRGPYDAVFAVGFPYTVFSYAALLTARAAKAPLLITPFLHLATPGDPVNRAYTKPHQIRLLAESDTTVVQTGLEAGAVRGWGIPDGRILTLGMGVEHAEVTGGQRDRLRSELAIPEDSPVIGHLATLDLNKGTNDLVLATDQLNRTRPAHNPIYLILAGPSSPDFERFLDELPTDSWPWLKRVGPLPQADRADFFASIDVFSMPSRTDSYGIVFLEAWANSLPVVAAAAGGVPDVVRDGEAGYLVPFGNLERLSGALGTLVDDPAKAKALGAVGRKLVDRGHTWDDRFATLEGRTRELIARRNAQLRGPHRRVVSASRVSLD